MICTSPSPLPLPEKSISSSVAREQILFSWDLIRARFDSSAITKSSSIWFQLDYKSCVSSSGRLSSASHLCRARLPRNKYWSDKHSFQWDIARISVISCKHGKTKLAPNVVEQKKYKNVVVWYIARINVITCEQAKTFFQCKKAANSVI